MGFEHSDMRIAPYHVAFILSRFYVDYSLSEHTAGNSRDTSPEINEENQAKEGDSGSRHFVWRFLGD